MSSALLVPPQHRQKVPQSAPSSVKTINGVLNLGKIGEARLDLIPQLAECNPGLRPTEYNVIVAPARVAKQLGASGSILAPDEYVETAEMAMQVGRIVSVSPLAFGYERWPEDAEHLKPKPGDIIWYARYAGALIESAFDGQMYRMIKDKDVAAVIEPPEEFTEARVKTTATMLPMEVGDVSGPMGSDKKGDVTLAKPRSIRGMGA